MVHSDLSEADRGELLQEAERHLQEAKRLKEEHQFQSSIEIAKQAVALYHRLEMWEECIESRQLVVVNLGYGGSTKSVLFNYLDETYQLILTHLEKYDHLTAVIFYHYALVHSRFGNTKNAIDYLYKSLEIRMVIDGEASPNIGQLYGEIGRELSTYGNYNDAIVAIKKGLIALEKTSEKFNLGLECNATEWGIERMKARLLVYYGNILQMTILYEEALVYLNRTLVIYQKYEKLEVREVINVYLILGHTYSVIGENELALLHYKKLLYVAQRIFHENHEVVATAKNHIAKTLIAVGAYEEAVPYLEEVVYVCENLLEVRKQFLSQTYLLFVSLYIKREQLEEAFLYAEKSLVLNTELFGEKSTYVVESEMSIADVYQNKNQYDKALDYFHQALSKCSTLGIANYEGTAKCLQGIGNIMTIQKKHRSALDFIQESLQVLCLNFDDLDIYQNPNPKDVSFHKNILQSLLLKADVFFRYYQENTKNIKDYKAALSSYELVDEVISHLRQSYHSTQSKLDLAAKAATQNYSKGIYAAFHAPTPMNQTEWAFEFSEKAKAAVLYASLQENLAKATSNIPAELLQKEKDLKIQLTTLDKSIQKQEAKVDDKEEELLQKLQNEFFDLHQEYKQLIESFEKKHPDYHQLKYETKAVSVEMIQQSLLDNQWMVSYFIGESHYYIFFMGKGVFEALEYEKPAGFEQLVEDFLQSIQNHQLEVYAEKAYELYQYLLQPLEMYLVDPLAGEFSIEEENSALPQLTIIPHGILNYVPFEALVCTRTGGQYAVKDAQEEKTKPYQSLDYLLLHCKVSYHYSATLWHYLSRTRKGERASIKEDFVGFAPVYQSKNTSNNETLTAAANEVGQWATRSEALRGDGTWTPLPYSQLEAEQIEGMFAAKGLSAQTFLHEQATKEQFREVVEHSRFLLVAAHGVVNDKRPKLSGLVFYPNPPLTLPKGGSNLVDGVRETMDGTVDFQERTNPNAPLPVTNHGSLITNHQQDCILSMEETYHFNLQADLVVLSSCESGVGTLANGEGMMAVNRGFLYAGAKNVVSTLFKVYDKPSSLLTQYLFEAILEGKGYSTALRLAKLRLLQMEEVDVKSWSGFVLIGA